MSGPTVHPRPGLARAHWLDLTGAWEFCFDDEDRGLDERWYAGDGPFDGQIVVPFPPESKLSQVHYTGDHPVVWYRRTVPLMRPEPGRRVVLHFGAVDYHAQVWVNGGLAVAHEGGHTPFSADITHLLRPGQEQLVVVRAADRMSDVEQPRGKQDWAPEPHKVWYHRTSGIWQPVWAETVPDTHIVDLQWTPDLERGTVTVEVTMNRPPAGDTWLDLRLTRRGEPLAEQSMRCVDERVEAVVPIAAGRHQQDLDSLLWSPESPTLVEASVRLRAGRSGQDEVASYFGYRSVATARGHFCSTAGPTSCGWSSVRATGRSHTWQRRTPPRCTARRS